MASETDEIGFGVIGVGFGHGRAEIIKNTPGARLVAVSSRDAAKADAAARDLGCEGFSDYRRMLDNDDIKVIALYTPSAQHRDIAIEAAQAGKHLIVTKPLEITLERIDEMIAACDAAGVKMATEYVVRYEPANNALYDAVQKGALGALILGEFSEKLYRPQWYYELDGGWRSRWATGGGGTVINQGIHTLDQMLWLMGDVESVTAEDGAFASDIESEDTAVVLIKFKNGALGTFIGTTTFQNPRPGGRYGGGMYRRIEVNGTDGSARLNDEDLSMLHLADGTELPRSVTPTAANVFEDMIGWVKDDDYDSPTLVKPGSVAGVDGIGVGDLRVGTHRNPNRPITAIAKDTTVLKNFEHVGVTVSDIDQSLRFYCDLLGLKFLLRRAAPKGGGEVAFVDAGGGQLELIRPAGEISTPARRPAETEAGVRHMTFTYDDMDAVYDKLMAAGVPSVEPPRDAFNKDILARVAFVLDPDGIVIELAQR